MKNNKTSQAGQLAEHAKFIADKVAARQGEPVERVIAEALQPLLFPVTVEPTDLDCDPNAGEQGEQGPWSFHGQEVTAD